MTTHRLAFAAALGIAVLGTTVTPRDAAAQTASEIALARQWFADGRALEDKGDWAGALEQFKRAAQVKKTPQILYHLGLCASRTGKLVQAIVDLDAAVTLARSTKVDDVLAVATAELAEVKKRVASLEVRVEGKEPARFVVDGQSVALAAVGSPMPLDPGEHTITVELASGASATKKVTLAERDAQKMVLVPEGAPTARTPPAPVPAPAPAPAAAAPPPKPVAETSGEGPPCTSVLGCRSAAGWTLVIGGATFFAAGATLFIVGRSQASSLEEQCPTHTNCAPELKSDYDSASAFNGLGIALASVGVAAAALGVTLVAVAPSKANSTSARIVVSPRSFALSGQF